MSNYMSTRSAPKIFDALASTFEWVLKEEGVSFIHHYLDDFITAGPPESGECQHNLATGGTYATNLGFQQWNISVWSLPHC